MVRKFFSTMASRPRSPISANTSEGADEQMVV